MLKEDFIQTISKLSHNELNDFVANNGKKAKLVPMFIEIKKLKENDEQCKN